jgi:hypothetical protein
MVTEAPTAEPTPAETSGSSTQTSGLIVDWKEASDPGFGYIYDFTALASANGLLVAVGEDGEEFDPVIWTSSDGRHWQTADFADAHDGAQVNDVVAGGPGFVAVGGQYMDDAFSGVVWVSSDGQSWQRVDADAFVGQGLDRVASVGGNLVAFSTQGGGVVTSSDGMSWTTSSDPGAIAVANGLLGLASDGSTLWAFTGSGKIDVWRTTDGLTWTQTTTIPGSQGTEQAAAGVGSNGMVLVALSYHHDSPVWTTWFSTDGVAWQTANQSPTDITDILADPAGFVAVGHYNTGAGCALDETDDVGVTWTSVDGITWRQMPEKGWHAREVQVVTSVDRTLIGLGADYNVYYDSGDSGLEWTAQLPDLVDDQAPPPSPTPQATPAQGCGG